MHGEAKMTLGGVLAIVGVIVVVSVLLIPLLQQDKLGGHRVYCMSNLRSINSAHMLYKSANEGVSPWLYDTMTAWDTTPVGTNRNINPFGTKDDPNNPRPRSITALMFMLVRQDQPAGLFRCPSDRNALGDDNTKFKSSWDDGDKDSDLREREYYLDFSKPENVSYSWQAPVWKDGRFLQGIDRAETNTVVIADMTPAGMNPQWKPANITQLTGSAIEAQNSPNHRGEHNNILMVAGNVKALKRPEVATGPRGNIMDNIYTAGGSAANASQWQGSTSLDIRKHLSNSDTFLIGPVGRKAETK